MRENGDLNMVRERERCDKNKSKENCHLISKMKYAFVQNDVEK